MRTPVSLLEWLAIRAGADTRRRRSRMSRVCAVSAAPALAATGEAIGPDRAGRLVPVPQETLDPVRSLEAHWALWAAVLLVVLIVGAGYLRRRWRSGAEGTRTARLSSRRGGDAGRD